MDVKKLEWKDIKGNVLTTRIIQAKTGQPVTLTLHSIAKATIEKQKAKLEAVKIQNPEVFSLPTADGANKILDAWVKSTGIDKYITCGIMRNIRLRMAYWESVIGRYKKERV